MIKTRNLPKVGWIQHTAFHWQTRIGDEILDYWPTKVKWRFRGETYLGHYNGLKAHRAVREFIAAIKPTAKGHCRDCKHWTRGIGGVNDDDMYGICAIKCLDLPSDEVAYTAQEETCEHWEIK
jgi:hypothetical protein